MLEEKVKNRGWVKNAAIIFLSVLLVLTFFSNTIMNRSLPEVAAQYVQSGTITTRIRGTGTIEASETYEVKSTDSRKVKSVSVRVGDEVAVGDVLFVLAAGDSDELTAAQKELDDLQYNYQVQLINSSATATSSQVQRAREKLADAITNRNSLAVTSDQIDAAKTKLDNAKAALAAGVPGSVTQADVEAAAVKMNSASSTLDTVTKQYEKQTAALKAIAQQKMDQYTGEKTASEEAWIAVVAKAYGATVSDEDLEGLTVADIPADVSSETVEYKDANTVVVNYLEYKKADLALAYTRVGTAQAAYDEAKASYDTAEAKYSALNGGLIADVAAAQSSYDALVAQKESYDAAKDEVLTCQTSLEQLLTSQQLGSLESQKLAKQIAEKQAEINKLSGEGGVGGEIVSDVAGVVKTINVTAGNTTDPATPLATIEVPDRGYIVSISVTKEQAQKVTVGSSADISNGYWGGSSMSGKLVSIRVDSKNPTTNKLLVFEVTGDSVESGTEVTVSIGQKSQSYDLIVPLSALRSDTNGDFVLIVVSKSSPLGNRYVATRIDVQIQAKDDTNAAVTGGLSQWDYVITTASAPVENGTLVRLPD